MTVWSSSLHFEANLSSAVKISVQTLSSTMGSQVVDLPSILKPLASFLVFVSWQPVRVNVKNVVIMMSVFMRLFSGFWQALANPSMDN